MRHPPSKKSIDRLNRPLKFFYLTSVCCAFSLFQLSCVSLAYRFVYSNIDYLLARQVDHYFDTDKTQEKLLRSELKKIAVWHKKNELPKYLDHLRSLRDMVMRNASRREFSKIVLGTMKLRDRLYYKLEPALLSLSLTLSEEQVEHFAKVLDKENKEEYEEKFSMSPQEQTTKRIEKSVERMESWFDDLNPKQKKLLKAFISANPRAGSSWFEEKKRNQQNLIQVLKGKRSRKKIQKSMRALFRVGSQSKQTRTSRKWTRDGISLFHAFTRELTEKQKRHFDRELTDLENKINSIIKS